MARITHTIRTVSLNLASRVLQAMRSSPRFRDFWLYIAVVTPAHLIWEILQLPLYTIWNAPLRERAIAVLHCTLGDTLIAASTLAIAFVVVGKGRWPVARFWSAALLTGALGVIYAGFSEWLNVVVRGSWAYASGMPVLTVFGFDLGLSPVFQWIIIPALGFPILWRRRASPV